ncbi:MAG TPA: MurT ligase domain-containing protein [Solirubrobacteraceae bacterium]|jgi:UDP-N-acetylmuramyl tripeptide synthase|nr:MurT ligase domain-containing protein [Solirubrobacteraceae bacterium]
MTRPSPAKLALARGVGAISRLRGGGGTSAPGKLLMRLEPNAIGELGARLEQGSVLVSATNGKTTTATMIAGILEGTGVRLVHNRAGANMAGGIATTLLAAARPRGAIDGQLGLFEVDELWLGALARELHPRAILLANLFRDQLDRYGELETIAERWEQTLRAHPRAQLVLNADDPLVADLGRTLKGTPHDGGQAGEGGQAGDGGQAAGRAGVLYFGVEDDSLALAGMAHAADAKHCRRCGAPYVFDAVYLGHLGHYHCPSCGQTRPRPTLKATDVRLNGVRSASFTLHTPAGRAEVSLELPGLYNVYNALAAAALATALDVPLDRIVAGLRQTRAAFGRAESVTLAARPRAGDARPRASTPSPGNGAASSGNGHTPAGRELRILLVKNPAGANEVLRTLALEPGEHDLLGVLNDHIADGRDVSWIWDADFELLAGRVRRATCAGTRAADLAARLKYAGIEPARIHVREQLAEALDDAAADRPAGAADSTPPLFALPTYTAMLELRELLVARGEATSAWS